MSRRFFAGLDLGQPTDYTALIIAEKITPPTARAVMGSPLPTEQRVLYWELDGQRFREPPAPQPVQYDVRHLVRFPIGTSYPAIVEQVSDVLRQPELAGEVPLIVDATGVGRPVVDLFRKIPDRRGPMVPVVITAGEALNHTGGYWYVAKQDLVSTVQVLLQSKRLRFAQSLPETTLLISELQNYRMKVTHAANEVFHAREGAHDDLVLALALACWYGERPEPAPPEPSFSYRTAF